MTTITTIPAISYADDIRPPELSVLRDLAGTVRLRVRDNDGDLTLVDLEASQARALAAALTSAPAHPPKPAHSDAGVTYSEGRYRAACTCGHITGRWLSSEQARSQLNLHIQGERP